MAGTGYKIAIAALADKYARLNGELEVVERVAEDAVGLSAILEATARIDQRKREINEALEHIEAVIWLFDADWNPAAVAPIYPRKIKLQPGAISKAAYNVLRRAKAPMSTREIAREVAAFLDVKDLDESKMAAIDSAIAGALTKKIGKTIQVHNGPPRRWSVRPAEASRAGSAASEGGAASIHAIRPRRVA
ncbi:hypothetical protein PMI01_02599 [Caulobacter sp. AP07]|nr:hypothetical protein [Caulobacter sp. AP07]EJL32219.1 hypothetical protein PMI01_02599 [Caulobacter sp. AP07]